MIRFKSAIYRYELISDGDDTTIAEDEIADDSDRARDGELEKMTTGYKGEVQDLFHTVGHLVSGLVEGKATELQDLAILRIAHAILV